MNDTSAYETAFPNATGYVTSRWGSRPRDERRRLADAYRAGFKAGRSTPSPAVQETPEGGLPSYFNILYANAKTFEWPPAEARSESPEPPVVTCDTCGGEGVPEARGNGYYHKVAADHRFLPPRPESPASETAEECECGHSFSPLDHWAPGMCARCLSGYCEARQEPPASEPEWREAYEERGRVLQSVISRMEARAEAAEERVAALETAIEEAYPELAWATVEIEDMQNPTKAKEIVEHAMRRLAEARSQEPRPTPSAEPINLTDHPLGLALEADPIMDRERSWTDGYEAGKSEAREEITRLRAELDERDVQGAMSLDELIGVQIYAVQEKQRRKGYDLGHDREHVASEPHVCIGLVSQYMAAGRWVDAAAMAISFAKAAHLNAAEASASTEAK